MGAVALRPKPVLRVAHVTDIHVKPTGKGPAGMRACLRHVHALDPKPDLILNGGDCIMDALGATAAATQAQWDLWKAILTAECRIPMEHCIGNHDIWGWQKPKSGATGAEPLYGKAWALKELALAAPYRAFDRAGWRFIVIDSVQDRGDGGYKPMLDEPQFEWLSARLAETPATMPVLILSHVPFVSVGPFYFTPNIVKDYKFLVPGALLHQDSVRIKDLLVKHPQVKLCLSGHTHLADRVEYAGLTFINNGAVSGSWWHGPVQETKPGYGVLDLYADGTFDHKYLTYEWDPA